MDENGATPMSHLHDKRRPFTPCNHPGRCDIKNGCMCAINDIVCEKTCACSSTCYRKFGGCRCAAKGRICRDNDRCECWALNRECDPELCLSCGAHEILDPANRRRADIGHGRCANVAIQRNMPKRTILGISEIMAANSKEGLGLYIGEHVRKGDYIDEYVGEIVSDKEAESRAAVYDQRDLSYLFDLNGTQAIDSTYMGNKSRFINSERVEPNMQAKVLFCNGVQRIGMFAARAITPGEELCFNYKGLFSMKFPTSAAKADGPTLSKNGKPIGRPKKNSAMPVGPPAGGRPLSMASASTGRASGVSLESSARATPRGTPRSSTAGTPRGTRKRRRGELDYGEEEDREPEAAWPAEASMFHTVDEGSDETDHSMFSGEPVDSEDEVAESE